MSRWNIFCAVALRKMPELVPKKDIIEAKVQHIFDLYEVANSRYSKHELQMIDDKKAAESEDEQIVIKETAQDKEDRWLKESAAFKPVEYNDRDTRIQYLFIKSRFGSDIKDQWLLPQVEYKGKDTNLAEAAKRALSKYGFKPAQYTVIGKVPASVLSFKYPKKIVTERGFIGAKVFYMRAYLDHEIKDVKIPRLDLKWMTKDEARGLVDKKYMAALSKGLLSEARVDVQKVLDQARQYAVKTNKVAATGSV